jgi:hypothetical protein
MWKFEVSLCTADWIIIFAVSIRLRDFPFSLYNLRADEFTVSLLPFPAVLCVPITKTDKRYRLSVCLPSYVRNITFEQLFVP